MPRCRGSNAEYEMTYEKAKDSLHPLTCSNHNSSLTSHSRIVTACRPIFAVTTAAADSFAAGAHHLTSPGGVAVM